MKALRPARLAPGILAWLALALAPAPAFGAAASSDPAQGAPTEAPPAGAKPLPSPVPAEPPIRLTLDRSIELALQNATAVLKSRSAAELTGSQLLQAYAQFLPTLSGALSYGYSSGKTLYTINGVSLVDAASRNASFDVSSQLNLFNGLSDWARLKASLDQREASLRYLDWARSQVALDVTQGYLQLVLDRELLDIARRSLDASRARLRLLQGQARVGSATVADLYRQQAQTSADELAVSTYESRAHDDQMLLLRKLRLDLAQNYVFEPPALSSRPSPLASRAMDELLQAALERRGDLRAQELRAHGADWDVTRAKGGYLPRLDLSLGRSSSGRYLTRQLLNGASVLPGGQRGLAPQLGDQVAYSVSLDLSWSLFDRFVTRLDVAQARRSLEDARVDASDARLLVEADVRVGLNDYQVALRQKETARAGLAAAEKAYEAIQGRFEVGAASFIDVLTAQAALVQARASQVQAAINLTLREKALAYAVGELVPARESPR